MATATLPCTSPSLQAMRPHGATPDIPCGPSGPQAPQPGEAAPFSEAPAACTLKWQDGGVDLMLTLRDSTDEALFQRLKRVLPRIKAAMAATIQQHRETTPEAWCTRHETLMAKHTNGTGAWYSHQLPDGHWCKGK